MAVKNAIYQVDNGSGFDEIHFKTKASQVVCNDGKTVEVSLAEKVNKLIQTFKPTLVNGWTNYTTWDADFKEAQYYKDDMGIVHFEGTFTSGTNGYICVLPVGFKPSKKITFPVVAKVSTTSEELIVLQGFVDVQGNVGTYGYSSANVRVTFNFSFKAK